MMFDALRQACLDSDIKVISVDMFDTLIFRDSGEPKDLFRTLAEHAQNEGLLQDDDIESFVSLRIAAEEQARREAHNIIGRREVTLEQIYDQIPYFNSDQWCQLEIKVEQADWFLNEPLINILESAQKNDNKLVLLSDMYLPEYAILNFLNLKCPTINWAKIWVSGERKKSKMEGDIFPALVLELNITAEQVLHIGDNLISDVQMAQANNIQPFHLKISDYLTEINKLEKAISAFNVKGLLRLRRALLQRDTSTALSYYSLGAAIYGPVLVAFARWIVQRCHKHGIETLYCLLREGKIIADTIKVLFPEFDVRTISISRRSSLLPSMKELTTQQLYALTERRGYCLAELSVDIRQALPEKLEGHRDYCLSDLVKLKIWKSIVDWIDDNQSAIKHYLTEQSYLLNEYLTSKGLKNSTQQAILDWGCGGSMFNTISTLMNLKDNHYFLYYRKPAAQVLTFKGRLHCFQPQSLHLQSQSLATSPELSEVLLNQNLSSTIFYEQGERGTISIKKEIATQNSIELDEFKTAILDCAINAKNQSWLVGNVDIKTRARIFTILYRLIDYPLYSEAMLLKDLPIPSLSLSKSVLLPEDDIKRIAGKSALECWKDSLNNTGSNEVWWHRGLISIAHPSFLQCQGHLFQKFDEDRLPIILLDKLKHKKLNKVVIYGAGELGSRVHQIFKTNNITTQFFIDRRAENYTFRVDGLPVYSLNEANVGQKETVVIASNAFIKEIYKELKSKFLNNIEIITV